MMRRLLTLLLILPGAAAQDGWPEAYRTGLKRIAREQQRYEAKSLGNDLTAALNQLSETYFSMRGRPENPNVVWYDLAGYKKVFDQWAEFERQKGAVAQVLAAAGGADAPKQIVNQLLDALDVIVAQEEIMKEARPQFVAYIYDQEPAIRRYGAYQHLDALVAALGKLRDAEGLAALRKEGWADACAWDKRRRSDLARIALLDSLALAGDGDARPLLEDIAAGDKPRLRIAALEALARLAKKPEEIAPRLADVAKNDKCYAVRAAALDLLATAARDPAVVPALADALGEKRGTSERVRFQRALTAIVGTDLGREPALWREWFEARSQGREFKPDEARRTTAASGAPFDRPVLLLECTYIECMPCDIDLAVKRNWLEWFGMSADNRSFLTQWDVQKRDAKKLLKALPEDARFNLVAMRGICEVAHFEEEGVVEAKPRAKRDAEEWLDELKPGVAHTSSRGKRKFYFSAWCSPSEGLWAAYREAGLDPFNPKLPDEPLADTILYWGDGVPALGPIIHIEAVIDDIRRLHRFFRIPVHCVRLGNTEGAEETMKGIATATGGSYAWMKKP